MKKISLLSGIASLLSKEQLLNVLSYTNQKYKKADSVQNTMKKNLLSLKDSLDSICHVAC
jgi:hypothetical protein